MFSETLLIALLTIIGSVAANNAAYPLTFSSYPTVSYTSGFNGLPSNRDNNDALKIQLSLNEKFIREFVRSKGESITQILQGLREDNTLNYSQSDSKGVFSYYPQYLQPYQYPLYGYQPIYYVYVRKHVVKKKKNKTNDKDKGSDNDKAKDQDNNKMESIPEKGTDANKDTPMEPTGSEEKPVLRDELPRDPIHILFQLNYPPVNLNGQNYWTTPSLPSLTTVNNSDESDAEKTPDDHETENISLETENINLDSNKSTSRESLIETDEKEEISEKPFIHLLPIYQQNIMAKKLYSSTL